eukprot:1500994-Amphidinium_carterae.1
MVALAADGTSRVALELASKVHTYAGNGTSTVIASVLRLAFERVPEQFLKRVPRFFSAAVKGYLQFLPEQGCRSSFRRIAAPPHGRLGILGFRETPK